MPRQVWISTVILALLISYCSKAPENLVNRERIDGVEYVRNAAEPKYPDRTLSIEEELSIGGEDSEGNIILYEAGHVLVDDAENLFIVDQRDFNIKVFDPEGNFIRSIGKHGEGPGEFQRVGYLTFLPDGRLLVLDFQARRTSLFDSTGNFVSSHQSTKNLSRIFLASDASYFVQEIIREEGGGPSAQRKLTINEIDFSGKEVNAIGGFKLPEFKILSVGDIKQGMINPHSPQSIIAGDMGNQRLFHSFNDKYQIDVLDTKGKIFRKIERPYDPLPYTSEDKEKFLARYKRRGDEWQRKLARLIDFPSVKNVLSRLLADDNGNLWVQTLEMRADGDTTYTLYDIFSSDGTYDAKVWLEVFPQVIKNDKIYVHYADQETGYTYIKRYKMHWGEQ